MFVRCKIVFYYFIKMKQLLYSPVNSFFFRRKANTLILKCCLSRYIRRSSVFSAVQDTRPVITKPMSVLKKQKNIYMEKKFSTHPKIITLMDFDVWLYPKISRIFTSLWNFYVLKEMDDSFSVDEFNRSSIIALQVVTTLLSELRFSELEGLLTQECKEEIEKNLMYWPKDQISVLAVQPEKVINILPCEIAVFTDKNKKMFVEIRVIYHVWIKYSSSFQEKNFHQRPFNVKLFLKQVNLGKVYMYSVFNSKFIKELTKGASDQWTVSAINLKCFDHCISQQ